MKKLIAVVAMLACLAGGASAQVAVSKEKAEGRRIAADRLRALTPRGELVLLYIKASETEDEWRDKVRTLESIIRSSRAMAALAPGDQKVADDLRVIEECGEIARKTLAALRERSASIRGELLARNWAEFSPDGGTLDLHAAIGVDLEVMP